jgi:prepilin-type N-terminal cleavage/methylation domain-containing protein
MSRERGMTVLEIMIVLAIIGFMAYLAYNGFRYLSGAALSEDTSNLALMLRRTQLLAVESGAPARVVIDFDKQAYWVEVCEGDPTLSRAKEEEKADAEHAQEELDKAHQRLATLPGGQMQASSPEEEAKMAAALAGRKVGGRVCSPLGTGAAAEKLGQVFSGNSMGEDLKRALQKDRGVKFREVWVQHLEKSVSGGQVSISFFPLGWAEKAIVEVGSSDDDIETVLVHGLTGRVEIRAGALRDPDDHMLRDVKGEREAER